MPVVPTNEENSNDPLSKSLATPGEVEPKSVLDSVLDDPNEIARIQASHEMGIKINPDQAAKLLKLEMQTGLPSGFIEENFDEVETEAARQSFSAEAFRKANPKLANWISQNPNHYALAKEDLTAFARLEKTVEAFQKGWEEPNQQSEVARLTWKRINKTIQPQEVKQLADIKGKMRENAEKKYSGVDYFAKQSGYGTSQALDSIGVGIQGGVVGFGAGAGAGLVGLAPGVVAGGAGGAAVGALTAGAMYSYNLETALAFDELTETKDITGNGIDDESALPVARVVGVLNSAIETGSDFLLMKLIPGASKLLGAGLTKPALMTAVKKALAVPTTRAALVTSAKKMLAGSAIEGSEEFIQALVGSAGREAAQGVSGKEFAPDSLTDDLASAGSQAVDAAVSTILPGAVTIGAPNYIAKTREMKKAKTNQQFFLALSDTVKESKVFEALPEKGQELIKELTKDGPVENLYITQEAWNTYWQEKGVDPREMSAEVMGDNGTSYDEATKSGGTDLIIPTERYARKLAPTEHNNALAAELRVSPEEWSDKEIETYFQEQVKDAENQKHEDPAVTKKRHDVDQSVRQIEEDIKTHLAPHYPKAEAAKMAKATAEKFRARADALDMGDLPFDLYQKQNLSVEHMGQSVDEKAYAQGKLKVPGPGPGINQTTFPKPTTVRVIESGPKKTTLPKGTVVNENTGWSIDVSGSASGKTGKTVSNPVFSAARNNVDELLKGAVYAQNGLHRGKPSKHIAGWHYFYAPLRVGDKVHAIKLNVKETTNEGKKFYHLVSSEEVKPASELVSDTSENAVQHAYNGLHEISLEDFESLIKEERKNDPYFQDDTNVRLGSISFSETKTIIALSKVKDLTTWIHESTHWFLNQMAQDFALLSTIPEDKLTQKQRDYMDRARTTLKWLGVDSFAEIGKKEHEQFARGGEAYLMDEKYKAPSEEVRGLFAHFRAWMVNKYKTIERLGVTLTPEIKRVFDRLYATEEQIAELEAEEHMAPLFDDPESFGLKGKKAERYRAAKTTAREAAKDRLNKRFLRDETRRQEKEYQKRRGEIRAQVESEVNASPLYRALSILQNGTLPDGTPIATDISPLKISRKDVGDEKAKNLPRGTTHKDGLPLTVIAEMLGYSSGENLVNDLSGAVSKEQLIEQMTEDKMSEEFPELLTQPELKEEAITAMHSEKRSELLRMELEILISDFLPQVKNAIRKISTRLPSQKAIREYAKNLISKKSLKEINPRLFLAAEKRAAKEAGEALARGDFEKAFLAKQKELLNHELYRAAVNALEEVETALVKFKKIFRSDEALSTTRDTDLVNAARAVLAAFGLAKSDKHPTEYLDSMKRYNKEAYETVTALINETLSQATHYKQIPFSQFVRMRDTVDALWSLSNSLKKMEIEGKKLDKDAVKKEILIRLSEVAKPKHKKKYARAKTEWEKSLINLMGVKAALRRVESWVDAMDGGDPNGIFRRYIFTPISEAVTKYRIQKKTYIEKYLEMVKPLKEALSQKDIAAPELVNKKTGEAYMFKDKAELLGAILHIGNQSNLSKLVRGRGWGEFDAEGNLDTTRWDAFLQRMFNEGTVTKADMDFAQSVWNMMEELKPQLQKAHKDMYGFYFDEITAHEFETPWGTYRGGYVPAKADPLASIDADIRQEEADMFGDNTYSFPTTTRGATKSRNEAYAAPLVMDLRMIPQHIDWALRFSNIEPRIKEVARLLFDKELRSALTDFDPAIVGDMLIPWLQRAASQKVETPSKGKAGKMVDRFFKELRNRTGQNMMFAHIVNTLQQFTGLSIAFVKVKPKFLRNALWAYTRAPKETSAMVTEKSDFMKTRVTTNIIEVQNHIDDLLLDPSKYEKAQDFAKKHAYFMQAGTQNVVDVMVWVGAYDQAVEMGLEEKAAVREADSAVRQTQGSFNPEDISRFESGTPFVRAFTMFYSYFNMQANLLGTEFVKITRDMGLKAGAGRAFYVYTMGFMIPAALSEVLVKSMSGKFDEDDDDSYLNDFMSAFFGGQLKTVAAMVPIAGPVTLAGINTFNKKWYDDRISTSPVITMVESAVRAPYSVYKAIVGEGKDSKAVRDLFSLLGLLSGFPVAPLAKPIGYYLDVESGNASPSGTLDYTRGLVTGKAGSK